MRTQLELWQVVKDNFDEHFSFGICQLIDSLRYVDKINHYEENQLREELSLRLKPKESQRTLVVGVVNF